MAAGVGNIFIGYDCYNVSFCQEENCYNKVSWYDRNSVFYYEPCNCKPKPKIKKTGKSKYF